MGKTQAAILKVKSLMGGHALGKEKIVARQGVSAFLSRPSTEFPKDNPLTNKGRKIMQSMAKEYGVKKGKEVFYASANKGRIKRVHK